MVVMAAGGVLPCARAAFAVSPHIKDLTEQGFVSTFQGLAPDSPCLVEFYAAWCGACRAFAHTYDKVAAALDGTQLKPLEGQQGQPATVFVARMDCAEPSNAKICNNFSVDSYPWVTAGTAEAYAKLLGKTVAVFDGIKLRTTEIVLGWAAEALGLEPGPALAAAGALDAVASVGGVESVGGGVEGLVWTRQDVESATIFLFGSIMGDPKLHAGADKRAALLQLAKLWAAAHPSAACMSGAQRLVAFYPTLWPESEASASDDLRQMLLCGTRDEEYVACKSPVPGARGFTCGLWLSLHAAANRLPDAPGTGALLVNAMRAFNDHFFKCDECHVHLSKMLATPQAGAVSTRRDAALWLWRVHNNVNARLMQEEAKSGRASSGDDRVLKAIFPRTQVCPKCNGSKAEAFLAKAVARAKGGAQLAPGSGAADHPEWDLDVLYAHLIKTYGEVGDEPPDGVALSHRLQHLHNTCNTCNTCNTFKTCTRRGAWFPTPTMMSMVLIFLMLVAFCTVLAAKTWGGDRPRRFVTVPSRGSPKGSMSA
ncbi:hypothetical protein FOA52_014898 [Chlamydomonas sp. UWO 241]|nr:hypothetical protein FOA52_014898 [Chlamydomonas sp. UWO 241]